MYEADLVWSSWNLFESLSDFVSKTTKYSLIGKNNNIRTVQAESSKFALVSFDQGFQIRDSK